ncbi:hypothetical protein [Helicobacter sp. 11S02629-2]|uniref:hypothetical protein n=1 Tax=Helicobacter sp. 11S02629-2 TaxID=1476195 RepID=UPI000BA6DC4C|nr:hypothetical protein [Helicobacter sp. 11S02629-2]PAF46043.1 hypothetical protein BKH40_01150 [Helicobacter sp. 11S02629-2]
MTYFSGFCLKDEECFFKKGMFKNSFFESLPFDISSFSGKFDIVGFSKGAQSALRLASDRLKSGGRVSNLVLISPAFFMDKDSKFKALQLSLFKKNQVSYMQSFLKSAGVSVRKDGTLDTASFFLDSISISSYISLGTYEELEGLLNYGFEKLEYVANNTKIYIFLGGKDRIFDSNKALEFFAKYAIVLYAKDYNHFLIKE